MRSWCYIVYASFAAYPIPNGRYCCITAFDGYSFELHSFSLHFAGSARLCYPDKGCILQGICLSIECTHETPPALAPRLVFFKNSSWSWVSGLTERGTPNGLTPRRAAHISTTAISAPIDLGSKMDAAYLKENVGEVLAEGLAQVLVRQPEDSVEFLANWLLDYVDKQEAQAKVCVFYCLASSQHVIRFKAHHVIQTAPTTHPSSTQHFTPVFRRTRRSRASFPRTKHASVRNARRLLFVKPMKPPSLPMERPVIPGLFSFWRAPSHSTGCSTVS